MPRKPGLNSEFIMFDVVYEDGSLRSNRKVPRTLTGGIDGDKPAHEFLIEQDRDIAEKSGRPVLKIKSITRAGAKKKDRNYSERRSAILELISTYLGLPSLMQHWATAVLAALLPVLWKAWPRSAYRPWVTESVMTMGFSVR